MDVTSFPVPPYDECDISQTGELFLLHDDNSTVSMYRPNRDIPAGFTLKWKRTVPDTSDEGTWNEMCSVGDGQLVLNNVWTETVLLDEAGNEARRWQVKGDMVAANNSCVMYNEYDDGVCHLHVYNACDDHHHRLFSLKSTDGVGGTWEDPYVSISPDDRYYVADHDRQQLAAFAPTGHRLYQLTTSYSPFLLAASKDHLYVIDDSERREIQVHSAKSGAVVTTLKEDTLQLQDEEVIWRVWTGQDGVLYVMARNKLCDDRIITYSALNIKKQTCKNKV